MTVVIVPNRMRSMVPSRCHVADISWVTTAGSCDLYGASSPSSHLSSLYGFQVGLRQRLFQQPPLTSNTAIQPTDVALTVVPVFSR